MYGDNLSNRLKELEAGKMTAQKRIANLTKAVEAQNIDMLTDTLNEELKEAGLEFTKAVGDMVIPYGVVNLTDFYSILGKKAASGEKLTLAEWAEGVKGLKDFAVDLGKLGPLIPHYEFLHAAEDLLYIYYSYQFFASIEQALQLTTEGSARIQHQIELEKFRIRGFDRQEEMVKIELEYLESWD